MEQINKREEQLGRQNPDPKPESSDGAAVEEFPQIYERATPVYKRRLTRIIRVKKNR